MARHGHWLQFRLLLVVVGIFIISFENMEWIILWLKLDRHGNMPTICFSIKLPPLPEIPTKLQLISTTDLTWPSPDIRKSVRSDVQLPTGPTIMRGQEQRESSGGRNGQLQQGENSVGHTWKQGFWHSDFFGVQSTLQSAKALECNPPIQSGN